VMLRLFLQRQRASMSAYFTNSLTPPTGLGLLASPRGGLFSVGQRAARSLPERWPAVLPRGGRHFIRGSRPSTRVRGAAWSLPLLIGGGNGRQVARSRFALLPVAVLRSPRLDGGSRHFWLGVFCPRYSRNARRGLWAAALTWTKTISRSSAPRPRACLASGARTTTTCCVRARSSAASSSPPPRPWARHGFGRWPIATSKTARRPMAMSRRTTLRWHRSLRAGVGNSPAPPLAWPLGAHSGVGHREA